MKGQKCSHDNCTIREAITNYGTWHVVGGQIEAEAYNTEGDYHACVLVRCDDCGMSREYSKYKNVPKWLAKHLEEAGII